MDRILGAARGGSRDGDAAEPAGAVPTRRASDVRGTPRAAGPIPGAGTVPGAGTDPADGPLTAADASLLALVDRLAGLLDRSALSELEVGAGETTLILRKADGHAGPAAHRAPARQAHPEAPHRDPATPATPRAAAPAEEPAGPPAHAVAAPLTGIFYASPSPTTPPFVTVGQEVVAGQVIGLIEAMKLFNEIKSDASGRISRIAVENGKLVKAKQTLIEVVPL